MGECHSFENVHGSGKASTLTSARIGTMNHGVEQPPLLLWRERGREGRSLEGKENGPAVGSEWRFMERGHGTVDWAREK
jgi:hypothetical protein